MGSSSDPLNSIYIMFESYLKHTVDIMTVIIASLYHYHFMLAAVPVYGMVSQWDVSGLSFRISKGGN